MYNIIYIVILIEMYILFYNFVYDYFLLGLDNFNINDLNNFNFNGFIDVLGINYVY